jgi:hypothetical protein
VIVTVLAVTLIRAFLDILRTGTRRVAEVREEGGGIVPKLKGELVGGQRRPSSARAHGLHMRVSSNGQIAYREKSVIAREATDKEADQ